MRRFAGIVLVVFVCTFASVAAKAQRLDGSLRVTVTDASDASIGDASVTVTNEASNVSTTLKASSAGTYVFPNLLVGSYTVTVESAGFKKAVKKGVAVESNQVADTSMRPGGGEKTSKVYVEAGAGPVQTD